MTRQLEQFLSSKLYQAWLDRYPRLEGLALSELKRSYVGVVKLAEIADVKDEFLAMFKVKP